MVFSVIKRLRYVHSAPPMDNFVFKLCYRWTVLILVVFSLIVTCRLLFGYSFACNGDVSRNYYETMKCYDEGVYTLPAKLVLWNDEKSPLDPTVENFRRYQSHYPWVNLVFLVQAFNFYLPHLLWKCYEKGYLCRLTARLQKFFDNEDKRDLELCYLAKYALVTQGRHKRYAAMYIFFEACNFVISLAQTLWLIYFFDVTGVPKFLPNLVATWSDFQHFYFPPGAICDLTVTAGYSPLKTLTMRRCQLPLNSLYMKMFLFLHAWYILLTALCGLVLVCRIMLLVPSFRIFLLKFSSPLSEESVLLCVCMSYSDWFFLSSLQKSMTDIDFAQMIDKMSLVWQGKDDTREMNGRSSLCEDTSKDLESSV